MSLLSPRRTVWLFDLDNTLHHADAYLMPHINARITQYICDHLGLDTTGASALRQLYWRRYGATLQGLMRHHGVNPQHFLQVTHDFADLPRRVVYHRALRHLLRRLPGRRVVFSNGAQFYVEAVIDAMGLAHYFDACCGIERQRLISKPDRRAFQILLKQLNVHATQCIMVEDSATNLLTAKQLGMKTILISRAPGRPAWVDIKLSSILRLHHISLINGLPHR